MLEVSDNGCGLPELDRNRLVEPYVSSKAKGTGLGLAIVAKVMDDHDGKLILSDRTGGGARIRLVFPVAEAEGRRLELAIQPQTDRAYGT